MVHINAPLLRLAVRGLRCADDDVRIAVIVDIACRRDRAAKHHAGLVAFVGPRRSVSRTGGGAVVEERRAFARLAIGVLRSADEQIGVTVAIDIPGSRYSKPELSVVQVAVFGPAGASGQRIDSDWLCRSGHLDNQPEQLRLFYGGQFHPRRQRSAYSIEGEQCAVQQLIYSSGIAKQNGLAVVL